MIFLRNRVFSRDEALCVLSEDNGRFTVTFPDKGEFTFDTALVDYSPDIAYLQYSVKSSFFLTWSSEIAESRAGAAAALTRNGVFMPGNDTVEGTLVTFWVGTHAAAHITLPCFVESATCDIVDCGNAFSSFTILSRYIPEAAEYIQRVRAKQYLIRHVNELDSLAMLEAQLDIVSKYIIDTHPESAFAKALEGVMVSEVHSEEKLLDTITNQKRHLRALQKEYIATRGNSVNSNPAA